MMINKFKNCLWLLAAITLVNMNAFAQDAVQEGENGQITIPPLFEYVTAPDDLPDLQSRTDYLMDNFWKPFDFKNTQTVDQNALNHAFMTYVEAMPYSNGQKVMASVKKLIGNIKNNPGLSIQFAKAAEETLYGPRAELWQDEIYMMFLRNLIDNKKVGDSKKKKYAAQLALLERTSPGKVIPEFVFTDANGGRLHFNSGKDHSLIVFATADCLDCRYSNLKLDISSVVNELIEENKLNVYYIMADGSNLPADLPDKWIKGVSSNAASVMDVRRSPDFYVIDKNNKIVGKNLAVDTAILLLEELNSQE